MTDIPPRIRPDDPSRPVFHFTAPTGWINDPNGLRRWGDTFHLFYQYNPSAPIHDSIQWGHAISTDLLTWADRPIALSPDPAGADRDGCWSGVLVDDAGTPTIIYSARADGRELPALAVGDDTLDTWVKYAGNPIIDSPPDGVDVVAFRDHCVWQRNGRWHHLVGSGIVGQGGTAFLYTSNDLRHWSYEGPVLIGDTDRDGLWTGAMWECVDLFSLGGRDVLMFSAWEDGATLFPAYFTGRFNGAAFTPSRLHRLDYGDRYCYAPQTFDDRGRRVLIGWMQEGRGDDAVSQAGWSGCLTVPRELHMGADGTIHQSPIEEIATLRQAETPFPRGPLPSDTLIVGGGFTAGDIELDLHGDPHAVLALDVLADPRGDERTVIRIDWGASAAWIDRSASSSDGDVDTTPLGGPVPILEGTVHLRVLVDHSALEVFINGVAIAARVYPSRGGAAVRARCESGTVTVLHGAAWQIHPRGQGDLVANPSVSMATVSG